MPGGGQPAVEAGIVGGGAQADGVDLAPEALGLQMDFGVAVVLADEGLKNLRAGTLGQPQYIDPAMHASLGGLHRIVLIMNR